MMELTATGPLPAHAAEAPRPASPVPVGEVPGVISAPGSLIVSPSTDAELDKFFTTPLAPVLQQQPPARQPRRRRVYDLSNVRRSVRLAKQPAMPAMKKAQVNLCRRLGLATDEHAPVDQILEEYVAMFNGPLPEHVVVALTALFGIDNEFVQQLDEAMLELVGNGVDDLRAPEVLDMAA